MYFPIGEGAHGQRQAAEGRLRKRKGTADIRGDGWTV